MKVLKARTSRVRRCGRALLRYIRVHGDDSHAQKLRFMLARASAELYELARESSDQTVRDEVVRVGIGVMGVNDQVEATLESFAINHKSAT
jgi:hypothetical protein